jgi:hypothetical protein
VSKWLAAALALLVLTRWAAAVTVSPAAGTDEIRALHHESGNELQLQYARDVPGQAPQRVGLGIGKDYHYVRDGAGLRLYDYQLRRIYSVDHSDHFANDSLYAEIWFRATELENRVRLRKVTQQDPFWMETDLGITSRDLPRPTLDKSEVGDRTSWALAGKEVFAVRYDTEPVPASLKGGLRRLWGSIIHLHPDIADELAASGRIPKEFWVTGRRLGKDDVVTHWKLTDRHLASQASFPLPPQLTAGPTNSTGAYPAIFALLTKEVADKTQPPAPEVYVSRAEAAIDRGAGLDAMLWLIEMNLAQGHPPGQCAEGDPRAFCALSAKVSPLLNTDPRFSSAFARQSPDLSDRQRFDNLSNGYMLRLLWATRPAGKDVKREATERDLLAALSASPVADFTKDTGDFYAEGWQPFAAWQVWDLGRLMAGHKADDLLHPIDELEDQIYIGVPSLF